MSNQIVPQFEAALLSVFNQPGESEYDYRCDNGAADGPAESLVVEDVAPTAESAALPPSAMDLPEPGKPQICEPMSVIRSPSASPANSKPRPPVLHYSRPRSENRAAESDRAVTQLGISLPEKVRGPGRKRGQAGHISEDALTRVLDRLNRVSATPACDRVKILLTVRAGLRPCEVAGLLTRTLLTASGKLMDHVVVMPATAKRGKERHVPMHPQLHDELLRLFEEFPDAERIAYRYSHLDGSVNYQSVPAVTQWFKNTYAASGLEHCSGMSGRHTFADGLYRLGVPPLDIQRLLGHSRLSTTSIYLRPQEVSAEVIGKLGKMSRV